MSVVITLFQPQGEKFKEIYGKPYKKFVTLDERRLDSPEQFDPDGNLKMDFYRAVFECDIEKERIYFETVFQAIQKGKEISACSELYGIFNHPGSFQTIAMNLNYEGRPIRMGDVVKIQYKDEVTYLYCNIDFVVFHPVNVPLCASTLLKNHQFLIGLKPVHFEVEEPELYLILVHLSNNEVILIRNTIEHCRLFLNRPIVSVRLEKHHSLGEWVIKASFGEPEYIEGGFNILTGMPISVDIQ